MQKFNTFLLILILQFLTNTLMYVSGVLLCVCMHEQHFLLTIYKNVLYISCISFVPEDYPERAETW